MGVETCSDCYGFDLRKLLMPMRMGKCKTVFKNQTVSEDINAHAMQNAERIERKAPRLHTPFLLEERSSFTS